MTDMKEREYVLDKARDCVCGHREQDYGSPEDSFTCIAGLWSSYLSEPITPVDVAMMMSLLKIARVATAPDHPTLDCFVDLAGYAACGGELAVRAAAEVGLALEDDQA